MKKNYTGEDMMKAFYLAFYDGLRVPPPWDEVPPGVRKDWEAMATLINDAI